MPAPLLTFRNQVLAALQAARSRWPGSRLHLLYAPGHDDPLGLARSSESPMRDTALVPWVEGAGDGKPQYLRIVEFDCRRVAAYLLETDPAFDDPLLEDTITRAHHTLSATASGSAGDRGVGQHLCGWLISPDSAGTIARRFATASQQVDPVERRRSWLRWHDPRTMALLWPGMTEVQKIALLGEQLAWLAFDGAGHLVEFSSPAAVLGRTPQPASSSLNMTKQQWIAAHHVGLVNHIVDAWRSQHDTPMPRDAAAVVQGAVLSAEAWGLDGRDLQVFVMTAVALHRGFETDPALHVAVQGAAHEPGTLGDRFDALPPHFWARYRSDSHTSSAH